jgi:hypothetical protein
LARINCVDEERPLDEIKAHRHNVLADAESFRVVAIQFAHDLETNRSTLRLRVRNKNTDPFLSLRDATGLYIMTTSHLR